MTTVLEIVGLFAVGLFAMVALDVVILTYERWNERRELRSEVRRELRRARR